MSSAGAGGSSYSTKYDSLNIDKIKKHASMAQYIMFGQHPNLFVCEFDLLELAVH